MCVQSVKCSLLFGAILSLSCSNCLLPELPLCITICPDLSDCCKLAAISVILAGPARSLCKTFPPDRQLLLRGSVIFSLSLLFIALVARTSSSLLLHLWCQDKLDTYSLSTFMRFRIIRLNKTNSMLYELSFNTHFQ